MVELDVLLVAVGLTPADTDEIIENSAIVRIWQQRQYVPRTLLNRLGGIRLPGNCVRTIPEGVL